MATWLLACLWLLCTCASSLSLSRRVSRLQQPVPLSVPPTSNWEGIDGTWNTFAIRVGSPPQVVRGIISTTSQETWVINPKACEYYTGTDQDDCGDKRGGLYYSNQSSTYVDQGVYSLWIEQNLNYSGNAQFGYDDVGFGYVGEGMPTLHYQIVGSLAVNDFWYGHLGLHPKSTNFTNITQNVPSYMTSLYDQKLIPSVSWGYTAGAPYRFAKVQASLTLGGYDKARFIPNEVTFTMNPDTDRDLLVYINDVSVHGLNGTRALLQKPAYAFLDSTVPEIWLPEDTCKMFEQFFGLKWDDVTQLYFVTDAQRDALLAKKQNITFALSTGPSAQQSIQISLPYTAFDQMASPPYRDLRTARHYFPLRRAANDSQITLGRVFFQEAYLTTDWERQTFSVSQCVWKATMPKEIVPIRPITAGTDGATADHATNGGIPAKIIAGIVVGALSLIAALVALYLLIASNRRRRRQHRQKECDQIDLAKSMRDSNSSIDGDLTLVIPKHELDAGEEATIVANSSEAGEEKLLEAPENMIFELMGDEPPQAEADGRQLSEKEAIRVREHRYNGTDWPLPASCASLPIPTSPQTLDLRASTTDVSATSRENSIAGRSPISPVTDGTLHNGHALATQLRIDPSQVQIVASTETISTQATPGELLEGSNGWSFLPDRSTLDDADHYKRFSFER